MDRGSRVDSFIESDKPRNAKFVDHSNSRFGRLIVHSYAGKRGYNRCWNCQCDCGGKIVVTGGNLVSGHTSSCGCFRNERISEVRSQCLTVDITGKSFGTLRVLGRSLKRGKDYTWKCVCVRCGKQTEMLHSSLKNAKTCDKCADAESGMTKRTHGHTTKGNVSGTWLSFAAMKSRCLNPNVCGYHRYGGRGIKVCDRWINSFENFLKDMGERPKGRSIDRWPNNNGNYEPSNCRWATTQEQIRNRSNTVRVCVDGVIKPALDWCDILGISKKELIKKYGRVPAKK